MHVSLFRNAKHTVIISSAFLISSLIWSTANSLQVSAAVDPTYSPPRGAIFASPWNGKDSVEAHRLNQLHYDLVKNAQPNSEIYIASLGINDARVEDALVNAAVKRKVKVHISTAGNPSVEHIAALNKRLAEAKNGSYARSCKGSCFNGQDTVNDGGNHNKLYLFSHTGAVKNVVVLSSQNISVGLSSMSANDAVVRVGDAKVYNALMNYIYTMRLDADNASAGRVKVTSGKFYYVTYPDPNLRVTDGGYNDIYYNTLDNVKCNGAAPGYGTKKGKTSIKITIPSWDKSRTDLARKVIQLKKAGCSVQLITNRTGMTEFIFNMLRNGGINQIHYADRYYTAPDGAIKRDYSVHNKHVLISGVYGSNNRSKITVTGSVNFGGRGISSNDNTMLRTTSSAIYDDYAKNYEMMYHDRSTYARQYEAPKTQPAP